MKCETLQLNLSLYADEELSAEECAVLDAHLDSCPVCRQRSAEFRALQNDLRLLARPAVPNDLTTAIRNSVAVELQAQRLVQPKSAFGENFREKLKFIFMPYAVGTVASFLLAFVLLSSMLSTKNVVNEVSVKNQSNSPVILMASNQNYSGGELMITPAEYAAARIQVSGESPSVNPTGALVALTKSIVRGKMNDDEVVVVADVFRNGAAKISEVVEAPRNKDDLQMLEKALQQDPNDPAFLPADFDKRSDVVRVVLKIRRVEVVEKISANKSRKRIR